MTWHYEAERLDGAGGGELLASDLPLQNVAITQTLSGPDTMTATISPEVARLVGDDGLPILSGDWSTAIYAIEDHDIRCGIILDEPTFSGPTYKIEGGGFAGYAYGQPYTASNFWIQIDSIDAFRQIWTHLQSQPGGNMGLEVDATTMSGKKIGTALQQGQFDTISGPLTYESGPFRLSWYSTPDLGAEMDKLVQATPFDWRERHVYTTDGDHIRHFLDFGYPKIGRQLTDLRFVIGENVQIPDIAEHGGAYANEFLTLGAGEGAAMVRGSASAPRRGLRRVKLVADKSLTTPAAANTRSQLEVRKAQNIREITNIVLYDHPNAPVGAVQAGDELYLEGRVDWTEVGMWVRVTDRTITPDNLASVSLTVTRTDRMNG